MLSCFSHVQLFATAWSVALQAPLSMGLSKKEYWSGLPCAPPRDFPDPGIEPASHVFCIGGRLFTIWATRETHQKSWLPWWLSGKDSSCQCRRHRRPRFDTWVGKISGEGHGNPLQYSCLESPMDRGAWRATVHGVTKTLTRLSDWTTTNRTAPGEGVSGKI